MQGMCENALNRGVVTGPPTKEKSEMQPCGQSDLLEESLRLL